MALSEAQAVFAANSLVPLPEVLDFLGIEYRGIPSQLACPVHKFGQEEKPSAHLYEDNSIFCFTCSRQYGPVEVWAASRGTDSIGAAETLLAQWRIPEEKSREVSSAVTTPRRKGVPEGLLDHLEETLLEYQGKADLVLYRGWVQNIQNLVGGLADLQMDAQQRRLEFIRFQMRRELEGV